MFIAILLFLWQILISYVIVLLTANYYHTWKQTGTERRTALSWVIGVALWWALSNFYLYSYTFSLHLYIKAFNQLLK